MKDYWKGHSFFEDEKESGCWESSQSDYDIRSRNRDRDCVGMITLNITLFIVVISALVFKILTLE